MFLPTVKLVILAHSILVADTAVFIKGTFESNSRAYQNAIRDLVSLVNSEDVSLQQLKAKVKEMVYFNFRNNSNVFADAVWQARQRLISELDKRITDEKGEAVDVTSDSSTSSEVVKPVKPKAKPRAKRKTAAKTEKA